MKKNWKEILLIINIVLLCVCLVQITELKTELQNMRTNTGTQISNILTNLNNSYSYIEETLEEQASIVSAAEWEFGEIDMQAGMVEVKAYMIPKEYQPDETQTVLLCGTEEVVAEYADGKYVATMKVPLYEEVNIPAVMFKENGTIRTESLDWFFVPRKELLPYVYANQYGTVQFGISEAKENMATWTFSGDVEVDVKLTNQDMFEIEAVELVRCIDGKEVERFDITMDAMTSYNSFSYNWNPSYEIPFGSVQEIYVDVKMSGDTVYRSQINYCRMDEQGNPIDDGGYWENIEAVIYDADGNLLYGVDEELYK